MGRPPTHGAPSFRFFHSEVAQMETLLREHGGHVPPRELLMALANKFSNSQERSGKITVQMKQVWNWFQNRRYALRSKLVKSPGNPNMPPNPRDEVSQTRNVPTVLQQTLIPSGHIAARNTSENPPMEFEAKSARDGAWYDVQVFLSHRYLETGNPEVLVRFSGFGPEEDEWVNVRKLVRQRSLPCESSECVAVLPGDLILCFQEGKEQALYFDAHVLDAQRRRHDVRGCRCRFLVRYDHDQTEEIVPLRKVCRRPETDFRLQQLHGTNESASTSTSVSAESKKSAVDPNMFSTLRVTNPNHSAAVTVPPPTITNVAATTLISPPIPAPISVPILSSVSTPISAPTPSSSLTSASTQISAQSSTPIFAPTPSLNLTTAPSPSLASVVCTTPSSTLIFAPSSSSTPNFAPTPSSAPISAPAPSSTPISAPAPSSSPISAPAPSSSPISAAPPIPVSGPSPTPISDPSPSSTPISAAAPSPSSTPISAVAPSPSSTPISAVAPSPAVVSAPSPTPISAPSPTLNSAATASSISVSTSTLAPSLSPVIAPAPTTTTGPVSISSHTTVTAPESKIPETDCSGTSTGIASARDKIMNSGAAVAVMEAKEEEIHSNPETSVVTESNIPVEEMSDNAAVAVPEPEKVGISVPSEPTVTISASTTDGGQPVSTVAEGGSVTDKD